MKIWGAFLYCYKNRINIFSFGEQCRYVVVWKVKEVDKTAIFEL